jgi:hypothetical protein
MAKKSKRMQALEQQVDRAERSLDCCGRSSRIS